MFMLAASGLIGGLIWTLVDRRGGLGDRWLRFALASFGCFALVTAVFWIVSPAGTARMVSTVGGDLLMQQLVQGRAAVIVTFGAIALLAARGWRKRLAPAMLAPFVYNALMAIEATRAQFTPLATPERWIYVTLHTVWAFSFAVYVLRLPPPAAPPSRLLKTAPLLFAAYAFTWGMILFVSPELLVGQADGPRAPLLFHSAHAFGASLIALAAAAVSAWRPEPADSVLGLGVVAVASALLAVLAGTMALWALVAVQLAWATLFLVAWTKARRTG